MSEKRQLHFGAFMRPVTIHTGAWRYPGAYADANFNFAHIKQFAQTLERGRFDAFFMADHLAVLNMPMDALKRSSTPTSFEPLTLLPALAMATEHLGLVATGSTTYDEPYHVARRFASLDHISGGRAGWNVVRKVSGPGQLFGDRRARFGLDAAFVEKSGLRLDHRQGASDGIVVDLQRRAGGWHTQGVDGSQASRDRSHVAG